MPEHSISLSLCARGYDGHPTRMVVQPHTPDVNPRPGVHLLHAVGNASSVWELTPGEAESLARLLQQAVDQSRSAFTEEAGS